MNRLLAAELAWYVTGRLHTAGDGALVDCGYFVHLAGVATDELFTGPPGEATALRTFAASLSGRTG